VKEQKRNKIQIYFDILQLLCRESKLSAKSCPTRVAHEANLPYDRFQKCLDHLILLSMVSRGPEGKLVVTSKGVEFIDEYQKIVDFLSRMGLLP